MANLGPTQSIQYFNIDIFNGRFPPDGPRVVPIPLDFSLQQTYNVDLTLVQAQKQISLIQGAYIDNSLNASPLQIVALGTGQNISFPGKAGGSVPIFQTNPPKFTITCTGGQRATVFFTNVPLPACVWPSTAMPSFNANGYMQVTDVALDAIIASNSLPVTQQGTGNNNVLKPFFVADELFTGSANDAAAHNIIVGNPSFFITEVHVFVSGNASLAAAAEYTITLKDDATTIATGVAFLPNAAGTNFQPAVMLELDNIQYNSKGNAKNLSLTASAALTSGHFYWNIAGGLCSNIGP